MCYTINRKLSHCCCWFRKREKGKKKQIHFQATWWRSLKSLQVPGPIKNIVVILIVFTFYRQWQLYIIFTTEIKPALLTNLWWLLASPITALPECHLSTIKSIPDYHTSLKGKQVSQTPSPAFPSLLGLGKSSDCLSKCKVPSESLFASASEKIAWK